MEGNVVREGRKPRARVPLRFVPFPLPFGASVRWRRARGRARAATDRDTFVFLGDCPHPFIFLLSLLLFSL